MVCFLFRFNAKVPAAFLAGIYLAILLAYNSIGPEDVIRRTFIGFFSELGCRWTMDQNLAMLSMLKLLATSISV
jgi:hypothetical protein